jgi:hypothetical protein
LTRGVNALFPCPRCMVPQSEQGNLLKTWTLRKQELSQMVYKQALMLQDVGEPGKLEDLLKSNGLYLVEVWCASLNLSVDLHMVRMLGGLSHMLMCIKHYLLTSFTQFGLAFGGSICGQSSYVSCQLNYCRPWMKG